MLRRWKRRLWLESTGGPLLLLPESLVHEWSGSVAMTAVDIINLSRWWENDRPLRGDYTRARAGTGLVGLVSVGSGQGLVLHDEPLPTTWRGTRARQAGVLIRWGYAESEVAAERWVRRIPQAPFRPTRLVFPNP